MQISVFLQQLLFRNKILKFCKRNCVAMSKNMFLIENLGKVDSKMGLRFHLLQQLFSQSKFDAS